MRLNIFTLINRLSFIFLLTSGNYAFCQSISGVIKNPSTNAPIAFVNLKIPNSRLGTSTDIDGKFSLNLPENYDGSIIISHVSYEGRELSMTDLMSSNFEIFLLSKTTNLNEITFVASENPAHEIIRKTVVNRKKNDPNRLSSYQYKSYNKDVFKIDGDSHLADSILLALVQNDSLQLTKKDSAILEIDSFAKKQHLFVNESVTEKKYLAPGLVIERLLAINTSGFKSPLFATSGTDYQPLGFYEEIITILDKPYINPISEGTLRRYEFYLEDTTYYQQDTVFVLSFFPKKNKKFESLNGQISISKNGYAIRNVIAHSTDSLAKTNIKIQQSYQCFDGVWFPIQLNTDIIFKEVDVEGRRMILQAKSYLSEIEFNKNLSKKEFSDVGLELHDIDETSNAETLSDYRSQTLDSLDIKTYIAWDTLAHRLDKINNILEYTFTRRVPLGKFDLAFEKIIKINKYEKLRFGIGGFTNHHFSQTIELGAYTGYGFGDQGWKYGGSLKFNFSHRTNTYLKFSYAKDLQELGRENRFENGRTINQQLLRFIEGSKYDAYEMYEVAMHSRIAPFTYSRLSLNTIHSTPTYSYRYSNENGDSSTAFDFTEFSIGLRYAKKEKYMNLNGNRILFGHGYPVISLNYTQGINGLLEGVFDYSRIDLSIDFEKRSRFGHTKIYFHGGLITGDIPINKLITGQGNNSSSFAVTHYFQTMGLYEFVSDKEVSFFFNHNFGNILLNTKYMKPELILHQNISVGQLSNPERHQSIEFSTLENVYFESGVGLKNLLRLNYVDIAYFGIGAEAFYRHGVYAFTKTSDNFAVRFNFDFTF